MVMATAAHESSKINDSVAAKFLYSQNVIVLSGVRSCAALQIISESRCGLMVALSKKRYVVVSLDSSIQDRDGYINVLYVFGL
jgi:hypothetical protein